MKKFTLLVIAGFSATLTFAQEKPELVTDRPDQTEAPVLVPKGALQVETGFQIENDKQNNIKTRNFTYNTTLIKYGVNEHFELRFIREYLGTVQDMSETLHTRTSGISPMAIGVKIKLADEHGAWPTAALLGHLNLKTGAKAYRPSYTAADFRFSFAHTLSEKFSLSYNLGAEWDGETPQAAFLYTLSLGYKISDRAGLFVEGYSFFPEGSQADNRVDAGLTYLITPVVQWDLSGGFGLSENAPDSFISTGLSFRLLK